MPSLNNKSMILITGCDDFIKNYSISYLDNLQSCVKEKFELNIFGYIEDALRTKSNSNAIKSSFNIKFKNDI